ncbi:MAG: hypothetical protein IJ460_03330 [Clostridia bacterium]|nr:hypothetical protein [Clostridia bacterium]
MNYKTVIEMQTECLMQSTVNLLRSLHCFYNAYAENLQGDNVQNAVELGTTIDSINRFGHCIMEQIETIEQLKTENEGIYEK